MARFPNSSYGATPLGYESRANSTTISQFFNAVYAWMAAGLALTAVVAWWVSTQPQLMMSLRGPGLVGLFLVQTGLVTAVSPAINRLSATAATALFMLYAALNVLF